MNKLWSRKNRISLGIFAIVLLSVIASVAWATPPNPVPFIWTLSSISVAHGGPDLVLAVNSDNFVASSVVNWRSTARATTYGSAKKLTAVVHAATTASSGTGRITVSSAGPSGILSNIVFLPVGAST